MLVFVNKIENLNNQETVKSSYFTSISGILFKYYSGVVFKYYLHTQEEIDAFMQKEDVKWNQSIGLEQIYAQTYVEHYKNVDEMYAFWKRTNYPNWEDSKIIQFEEPVIQGVKRIIPRRVKFVYPNPGVHNAENLTKRIDVMKEDPQFGDESNEYGRLWWDVK